MHLNIYEKYILNLFKILMRNVLADNVFSWIEYSVDFDPGRQQKDCHCPPLSFEELSTCLVLRAWQRVLVLL